MHKTLFSAAAILLFASSAQAQLVDPDVRGPVRRGAGAAADALGAPGVENRIERRQERRDLRPNDPDGWRMRYYNDEWWYYTPQNTWMFYRGNAWVPYARDTYQPARPRYTTGYRGPNPPTYGDRRYSYGRPGAPMLMVGIEDGQFLPETMHVSPGTTVRWINRGNEVHSVTSADGQWDSGEIEPGETYSARFKNPGTYNYVCDFHQGMQGTIVVVEPTGAAAGQVDVDLSRQSNGNVDVDVDADRAGEPNGGLEVEVTPGQGTTPDVNVDLNRSDSPGAKVEADVDVNAEGPVEVPAPQTDVTP